MARLMRIVVAGLFMAVLFPAASGALSLPPYIRDKGIGFEAYTNRHWRAGVAQEVRELKREDAGSAGSKDPFFRIWIPNCAPGQKVVFTRTLDLLGPPSSVSAQAYAGLSVDFFEIWFNGKRAAHFGPTQSPGLDAADARRLKHGKNEVRFVVKLTKVPTACTGFAAKADRGAWLKLSGYFAADLRVGVPKDPVAWRAADETGGRAVVIPLAINNGRTAIPEGVLEIRLSGAGWCVQQNPDHTCKTYQYQLVFVSSLSELTCKDDDGVGLLARCTFHNLAPGERLKAVIGIRFLVDPSQPVWVDDSKLLSQRVYISPGGPGDTNTGNDYSQLTVHFCQYGVAGEACKAAP